MLYTKEGIKWEWYLINISNYDSLYTVELTEKGLGSVVKRLSSEKKGELFISEDNISGEETLIGEGVVRSCRS